MTRRRRGSPRPKLAELNRAPAAVVAVHAAVQDYSGVRAPGERGIVSVVASDRRQAGVALGYVKALFRGAPALRRLVAAETRDGVELRSGVAVEVQTASFRSA